MGGNGSGYVLDSVFAYLIQQRAPNTVVQRSGLSLSLKHNFWGDFIFY